MSERIEANKKFLENIFRKGPFQGHGFTVSTSTIPICEVGDFATSDRPVKEWVPWIVGNYRKNAEFAAAAGDDSVPLVNFNSGTHIYAAAMGAQTHYFEDSNPCALPFINSVEEAERIREPKLEECRPLMRIFELGDLVRQELGPEAIFGPPDMQSGFDTAALVWNKESIFCSMMVDEEKEAVQSFVKKCANLFKNFIAEFYRRYPDANMSHCPSTYVSPGMGPWLSNDECGALSVPMFEEFCLPELVDLSKTFGGLGMHCCADAEHQFPSFRKIPNFYAFNRVPAKRGFDPILEPLGGPQGPAFVLAWIDDEAIERLTQKAPAGTRFVFHHGFDKLDEAKAWLEKMRRISPRTDGAV